MYPYSAHDESLRHPLDPLSADEIETAARLAFSHYDGVLRIATVDLVEPPKHATGSAAPAERLVNLTARDPQAHQTFEGVVSLTRDAVVRWDIRPGEQSALIFEDCLRAEAIVRGSHDWLAALNKRGITDPALTSIAPWGITPDAEDDEIGVDERVVDCITMVHRVPGDNEYARPVEGLLVRIDLDTEQVVKVFDYGVVSVPEHDGNFRPDQIRSAGNIPTFPAGERTDLRPLQTVQPEGVSFGREGHLVTWSNWDFRVGWSMREGVVLYDIHYTDRGNRRPIAHRAAVSEMTVPYGDTAPMHRIRNAFDAGECGLGMTANSLELGCDCPGETQYLDGVITNEQGKAVVIRNAICMHEEDSGIAWKHTDGLSSEVRRGRRFVISFFTTIGNYDYGFFWYFNVDGSIQFEAKLTGIIATGAFDPGNEPKYGAIVAPGLYGPHHQHFFCVRIDPMVDGLNNTVYEHNSVRADDPENVRGNAWYVKSEPLATELAARRRVSFDSQRFWTIANDNVTNGIGQPTAYGLIPGMNANPMFTPEAPMMRRAGFIDYHLWVTRYAADELYAAGGFPHRSLGGDQGLPQYAAQDRDIVDSDLVVWYTFGVHHIVRPEDWPVMPVAHAGFDLRPIGFFDANPALDLPRPAPIATDHCHTH
ncbi:primary-amine oxidase [Herbiconiux sp. P17]|uniref:primary-amine oxidase n=1 Tax=Herbiconiux wuyangfengii TaxID=3342794 RepID=UPI0035B7CACF